VNARVHPNLLAKPANDSESLTAHLIHQFVFVEQAEIFNALVKAGQMEAAAIVRMRMDK
jgi:hypothetical protein